MMPLTNLLPDVTKAVENTTKTLHAIYKEVGAINDGAKIILGNLNSLQVHLLPVTKGKIQSLSDRITKLRSLIRASDHITDNQKHQLEKDLFVVATNVLQTSVNLTSMEQLIQNVAASPQTPYTHKPTPVYTLAALTEKSRALAFAITGLSIEMYNDAENSVRESSQLLVTKAFDFKKRVKTSLRLLLSLSHFCAKSLELSKEIKQIFCAFQATIQQRLEKSQAVVSQEPDDAENATCLFDDATQEASIAVPCYELLHTYVQTFQAAHKEVSCASLLQEVSSEFERQKSLQTTLKELEEEETARGMEQLIMTQEQYNADAAAFKRKALELREQQNGCVIS